MERGAKRAGVSDAAPVVSLCRRFTFSAAHRLHCATWDDARNQAIFGKCNNANGHGHNYVVLVHLRGPVDPDSGMVVNLSDVKAVTSKVEALLDHRNLDKDVAWFRDHARVSTTENVCVCIWETILHFEPAFAQMLRRVEVHETENNIFSYEGPQ